MLNFKPWWQDYEIKINPINRDFFYPKNQDSPNKKEMALPQNINQKLSYIFKHSNLNYPNVDGIIILDVSDFNKNSKQSSFKMVKNEFSAKINRRFKKSIISKFSKRGKIENTNKYLLISLNNPNKKLLVFFVAYDDFLIEFFYICDSSKQQDININQYQKDVEQIYIYFFPKESFITDNITSALSEVLHSTSHYINRIMILNISASSNSKYEKYFKVEKQIFQNKMIKGDEVIKKISDKKIWNRLNIISKKYLEMVFSHSTTIEIWNFCLIDKDNQEYAIVFWTKTPVERFNTGQYHIIYQDKIRECTKKIINLLFKPI